MSKTNKDVNIENELEQEIERRIAEMEKPEYEFPLRFSKRDYFFTAIIVVICLGVVIYGAFL